MYHNFQRHLLEEMTLESQLGFLRGSSRDEPELYLSPYQHRCLVPSPVKAAITANDWRPW
jgi:hypothetical protein